MSANEIERRALAYIDAHSRELFGHLTKLIGFETENHSSTGNEQACAAYIRGVYESLGLETELYYPDDYLEGHPGYLPGRDTAHRPNVGGVLRGTAGQKGLMLAAHIDTMPIGDRASWRHDPLGGEVSDGRIYGRGSGDDKCGIACGIFLAQMLRDLRLRPRRDLVLSAYCDEENGGGNGSVASCVRYPCEMYVNLDGGNGDREIWTCGIGGWVLKSRVRARGPRDSAAAVVRGLNVVNDEVAAFGARRAAELQAHRHYRDTSLQKSALRVLTFRCGDGGMDLDKGYYDFVFYTVSEKAAVMDELKALEDRIRARLDALDLDFEGFEPGSRYFDYIEADEDDPAIRLLLDCAGEVGGHPVRAGGACLSDFFLYYKYGSPRSVTYGIFRDFSAEGGAHQPDEYIRCEDFVNMTKALALFILRWCGCEPA